MVADPGQDRRGLLAAIADEDDLVGPVDGEAADQVL